MAAELLRLRWCSLRFEMPKKWQAFKGPDAKTSAVGHSKRDCWPWSGKNWLASAVFGFGLAQAQTVVCHIESSGETRQISVSPTPDAYALSSVDLPNGFRVSAQWLSVTNRLKTYVYYTAARAPVLISQQVLALPVNMCTAPFSQQMVYAGKIERELSLTCQLQCH